MHIIETLIFILTFIIFIGIIRLLVLFFLTLSSFLLQFELLFFIKRVIPRIVSIEQVPTQSLLLHANLLVVLFEVRDVTVVVHLLLLTHLFQMLNFPRFIPALIKRQERSSISFNTRLPNCNVVFIGHTELDSFPPGLNELLISVDFVEDLFDLLGVVGHFALLVKSLELEHGRGDEFWKSDLAAVVREIREKSS